MSHFSHFIIVVAERVPMAYGLRLRKNMNYIFTIFNHYNGTYIHTQSMSWKDMQGDTLIECTHDEGNHLL
jgi:hypothetical protein